MKIKKEKEDFMPFLHMPKRKGLSSKLISILILQAFIISNIAFALPKDQLANLSKQPEITTDPEKIVIPRDFGLVKSKFVGSSGRLVVHIQDAHCNYEAQSNIVKILENLIKNNNLTLVSVEGADGVVDTSWFKAFPDDEIRKEVADYFMRKGEITGPEFLSITSDYPITLFGAETRSYYIENLNAFTSSYPFKNETEKYFNQIKTILNRLKTYIYNEELKMLDAEMQDYESKKIQFNDYARFLQGMAEKKKINLREYENFFRLISVLIYEKKIDFNVTDKERNNLIDELSKRLSKDVLTELVSQSLSFKVGKISSADYYSYLKNLSIKNEIDLAKTYSNLYNYIIYNSAYSKIENEKLFNDIKRIEIAIKEKLFQNNDQRTLERLSRHIDTLLGLVNIKLLNGDFDYYQSHKEEFSYEAFSDFLKKKTIQYGLSYDVETPNDAVANSIPKLEDFYSIAIKRDKAIVENTLNAMKKDRLQVAVLITGGFHSEGITKMLEKQNISYMVVCPNITKDVPSPYIQILTNQRTPLEDILVTPVEAKEVKKGLLAPYLISAARGLGIRQKGLGVLAGRVERAGEVEQDFAHRYITTWIAKAEKFAGNQGLPHDKEILLQAFTLGIDNAIRKDRSGTYEQHRDAMVKLAKEVFEARYPERAIPAPIAYRASATGASLPIKMENLRELRDIVAGRGGVSEVIAIVNGGDANVVESGLKKVLTDILRNDGNVRILAHEESPRRGQLFGLLDAIKHFGGVGAFKKGNVSLGIMMPGKGKRMSPFTQRMFGIKPFFPMLIRANEKSSWLTGASASLYTWNLVAYHLKRLGFSGMAWKWGDEPQIAASLMKDIKMDLSNADIIRFGSKVLITDDMAKNKEWLNADNDGNLTGWARRRDRDELLKKLGVTDSAPDLEDAEAMVHIGSPAFSYLFLEKAQEIFGEVPATAILDVDGYLIEGLFLNDDEWNTEYKRDKGLRELVEACQTKWNFDFRKKCQELRKAIEAAKGSPLQIKVVDFGEELYWGDIGQLKKARECLHQVSENTPEGEFARQFAYIDGTRRDKFNNIIIGSCDYPQDGSVKNSVLIDTNIYGAASVDGVVLVNSNLGNATIGKGSVVYGSTVANLTAGERTFLFHSVKEDLSIEADWVHTSIPKNLKDIAEGMDDWWADSTVANLDAKEIYSNEEHLFGNPTSFEKLQARMEKRDIAPEKVEADIAKYAAEPILDKIKGLKTAIERQSSSGTGPTTTPHQRVRTALRKAESIFKTEAEIAKSNDITRQRTLDNLKAWLTEDRYKEYREALLDLVDLASVDRAAAKELYDSFWRTIPFGTGGRRWKMGIGPNRMNAYMVAVTAQGHVEYLKAQYPKEVARGDAVASAWDVRAFHKYFAETHSLKKYREIIEAKCPALAGLSSEDLSKIVGLVYAGNGITYIHSEEMRSTPWLSFIVNRFGSVVKTKPFFGKTGEALTRIQNVMAGIVLSSSHNPYDNNGTKFYENSGAQAPPQIVQKLMDLGDKVTTINYYGGESYYTKGRETLYKEAQKQGKIIVLSGENLKILDSEYATNVIEEVKNVYTEEEWQALMPWFERLLVSFNAINGAGVTNVLPIFDRLKVNVLRSAVDVPTWEFPEGYGNIPNPEAEKSFNTAMQIGIRRTLDSFFNGELKGKTAIKAIIDEDSNEIPMNILESENRGPFAGADQLLAHVKATRSKFIRGLVLDANDENEKAIRAFSILNNICLLTDPDADRVGLGMQKIERAGDKIRLHWLSANDNDESGIILFRHRLEKLREIARRGELVKYIEDNRRKDGKGPSKSGKYQLVVATTVVSNPLELVIAQRIGEEIAALTNGRVDIKTIKHHVGFKFTGEIIDNILSGQLNGITGVLMKRAGFTTENIDEAFFVKSFEEGEGGLIGYRGSIDKDSGVIGLNLAVLAAEQLSKDKTMYDYLMETYQIYGYSKTFLEPMVMTGGYGFKMINEKIMGYLRNTVLAELKKPLQERNESLLQWGSFTLVEGMDHYDLMKPIYGSNPETWPQAIRESVNILEFLVKLPDGTEITIVARPSGTEPKHKNLVMVIGAPLKPGEDLTKYINNINKLNREVMDEVMIASYKASEAEYDSAVAERPGKYRIADLSRTDLQELLRIFPIVVSCEAKLAVYFPLRDYIREEAANMADIANPVAYEKRYGEARDRVERYLINFKEKDGIQFVEESALLNLTRQINELPSGIDLSNPAVKAIYIQSVLWFGREIGKRHFMDLIAKMRGAEGSAIGSQFGPSQFMEQGRLIASGRAVEEAHILLNTSYSAEQRLEIFVGLSNFLLQSYAQNKANRILLQNLNRFYEEVIRQAAELAPQYGEQARNLILIAGQALNIISWVERGVPSAENMRLTIEPESMVKGPEKYGPSFLDIRTMPTPQAEAEGRPGIHHRGAEGIGKMGAAMDTTTNYKLVIGPNISKRAIYNMELFRRAWRNVLLYLMVHGVVKVPATIGPLTEEGFISTIHETHFLINTLPGSIQYASTGPGHFQESTRGRPLLDIKYVTEGEGIQWNKFYNEKGELIAIYAFHLKPGSWALALPGAVDSVENLGGLRFNDISIEVTDEDKVFRLLKDISDTVKYSGRLGFDEMQVHKETTIKEAAKTVPYYAVDIDGRPALVKNVEIVPEIKWFKLEVVIQPPTLTSLYGELTKVLVVDELVADFLTLPWDTLEPPIPIATPAEVTQAAKRAASRASTSGAAEEIIASGKPIYTVPAEEAAAYVTKQYAWGGTGISRWFGWPVKKIAEWWIASTHKDGLSKVPGTEITYSEVIGANPEIESKENPILLKVLGKDETQPQIVHIGFSKEKVENVFGTGEENWLRFKEHYANLTVQERELMKELRTHLEKIITNTEQFEEYQKAYSRWVSEQTELDWKDETKIMPELPDFMVQHAEELMGVYGRLLQVRRQLIHYLNRIDLKPGMTILSPVGYTHSIVGSHQGHPLAGPNAKNEAWHIFSAGRDEGGRELLLYFESQQTSNITFSPFDIPTGIDWKVGEKDKQKPKSEQRGSVIMRKDIGTGLDNGIEELLKPGEAKPTNDEEAIRIITERAFHYVGTRQEDFIVRTEETAKTAPRPTPAGMYTNPVGSARTETLVEGTYPVWPEHLWTQQLITLEGEGEEKPASITINPQGEKLPSLVVLEGTIEYTRAGETKVLPKGSSVFYPGIETEPYEIKSVGKAQVMRVYPPQPKAVSTEPTTAVEKPTRASSTGVAAPEGAGRIMTGGMLAHPSAMAPKQYEEYINEKYVKADAAEFKKLLDILRLNREIREEITVVLLYDTDLEPGAQNVVQAGAVAMNKYLGGAIIEFRGKGSKLLEAANPQINALQSSGKKFAIVTIAGKNTLAEIEQELLPIIKANNDKWQQQQGHQPISALLKVEDNRMSPIVLYNIAIRIGFHLGEGKDILNFLNSVALNGNGEPFKKADWDALLTSGFISLKPIKPINLEEAREAYMAQALALRSL